MTSVLRDLHKPSFRGIPFEVEDDGRTAGRRVQVHEYPGRDIPYGEDLGRASRRISISGFIIGDQTAADPLIAAIEKGGEGKLVHPYFGTMDVMVDGECNFRHTKAEGGMCRFNLSFVQASSLQFPSAQVDTSLKVVASADAANEMIIQDYASRLQITNVQDFVKQSASDLVQNVVDIAKPYMANPFDSIANVSDFASSFVSGFDGAAMSDALQLEAWVPDLDLPPLTTPSRTAQSINQNLIGDVVRSTVLVAASKAASKMEWDVFDDAMAMRDKLVQKLDREALASPTAAIYRVMRDLSGDVFQHVTVAAKNTPRLRTISPVIGKPSLVTAYNLHGDATRFAEIVKRNGIKHPDFIGMETIKVLSS